jgi:hypothetical protein
VGRLRWNEIILIKITENALKLLLLLIKIPMSYQTFSLQPFPSNEGLPNLQITGKMSRHDNKLTISYILFGNIQEVQIPPPSDIPERKHELWKDTCFEFFLGVKDFPGYWEFNFSPAGHWNVYRFDEYRQGMKEETAFDVLPFTVEHQADSLTLVVNIDLDQIVSPKQVLDIGITAVIKYVDEKVTYWAITHSGTVADFHLRDTFTSIFGL